MVVTDETDEESRDMVQQAYDAAVDVVTQAFESAHLGFLEEDLPEFRRVWRYLAAAMVFARLETTANFERSAANVWRIKDLLDSDITPRVIAVREGYTNGERKISHCRASPRHSRDQVSVL